VLQTSDNPTLTDLVPVAKTLLERGGFKVDAQSMDWQTPVARRAKKDPVAQGGWNIAQTAAAAVLLLDPVNNHHAEASGDRAGDAFADDAGLDLLAAQHRQRQRRLAGDGVLERREAVATRRLGVV
jgi:peptide/nickel transport system substrate-binding protein